VPTADTPEFITSRLEDQRGIVLLVYVDGAADDMEMLDSFNAVKAQYAADSSFLSFEARKVTELGDTLQQLRVSNPPVLAVVRGTGDVAQLYTGWIDRKVMEQVVATPRAGSEPHGAAGARPGPASAFARRRLTASARVVP